jgi:DNA (cytosine-5)-methyltransferase 1
MTRPRLLDLFCGAGGAARGNHDAGFDVFGVDNVFQPNYPYSQVQADALTVDLHGFDVIHASPPCQRYSTTRALHANEYPDLIAHVRARLREQGRPFVIENVVGAPLLNPLLLCGSSFDLGVRRHRLFETSPLLVFMPECVHHLQPEPLDVTGGGPVSPTYVRYTAGGISRKPTSIAQARHAMGIEWRMTRREVAQAVPPAYTKFIGEQLALALA